MQENPPSRVKVAGELGECMPKSFVGATKIAEY
jgi:hypothetical protein